MLDAAVAKLANMQKTTNMLLLVDRRIPAKKDVKLVMESKSN